MVPAFASTAQHAASAGTLAHRVEQLLEQNKCGHGALVYRMQVSDAKRPPCRQDPAGRAAASLAWMQNLETACSRHARNLARLHSPGHQDARQSVKGIGLTATGNGTITPVELGKCLQHRLCPGAGTAHLLLPSPARDVTTEVLNTAG